MDKLPYSELATISRMGKVHSSIEKSGIIIHNHLFSKVLLKGWKPGVQCLSMRTALSKIQGVERICCRSALDRKWKMSQWLERWLILGQ
jgi:hypothetical protein